MKQNINQQMIFDNNKRHQQSIVKFRGSIFSSARTFFLFFFFKLNQGPAPKVELGSLVYSLAGRYAPVTGCCWRETHQLVAGRHLLLLWLLAIIVRYSREPPQTTTVDRICRCFFVCFFFFFFPWASTNRPSNQ
jgi:hypothetical protein